MKKLALLGLTLVSSFALASCGPKEVEYTYDAYTHMILQRSLEPAPYTEATLKIKETGQPDQIFMYENNGEAKYNDNIDDIYDDLFYLVYFGEEGIAKCHFYATDAKYRMTGTKITYVRVYHDVTYESFSFEYKYDSYGMPTYRVATLYEKDSSKKIKITQTYTYK